MFAQVVENFWVCHWFEGFIQEKVCPLLVDVVYENLGLSPAKLRELWKEIHTIVNGTATINFYERSELISVNKLFEMAYCGSISQ
jgi:thioester reductase-like protein